MSIHVGIVGRKWSKRNIFAATQGLETRAWPEGETDRTAFGFPSQVPLNCHGVEATTCARYC